MKTLSVSIGIPAFNEEDNIKTLIKTLLTQHQNWWKLKEIIVVLDGSTDSTPAIVKDLALTDHRIKLFYNKTREGQQVRQNQILDHYTGDILVIMEADMLPYNADTIAELVRPFTRSTNRLGMVVGVPIAVACETFLEKILNQGAELKKHVFAAWKKGQNIYTSGGHSMRALSRVFTKNLRWPANAPEDAYTYLRLRELGLEMERSPKAFVYMRNVTNVPDRIRQLKKFKTGKKALEQYFSKDLLKKEYTIPWWLILFYTTREFVYNPIWTLLYILEYIYNRLHIGQTDGFNPLYTIYKSSKKLTQTQSRTTAKTVAIGIPAYNEAANIGFLLRDIFSQAQEGFEIKKIIIISDGSTDKTRAVVTQLKDGRIQFIDGKKRRGQAFRQNQIIDIATEDILILFNADILLNNIFYLKNLLQPLLRNKAHLVSGNLRALKPQTFIERIIYTGFQLKMHMFALYRNGQNVYTCHGAARAFSKKLYKNFQFKNSIGEDAFSYLFCVTQGYKYQFVKNAAAYIKLPHVLPDHQLQSIRFFKSIQNNQNEFGDKTVQKEYNLPVHVSFVATAISFCKNPFYTILYVGVVLFTAVKSRLVKTELKDIWDISKSSKVLRMY